MKKWTLIFVIFFCNSIIAQNFELKNEKLRTYYIIINDAELNIVDNDLKKADDNYQKAFFILKEPNAKDIYNSMLVSIKLKNFDDADKNYSILQSLGFSFDKNFFELNFPSGFKSKYESKLKTIDENYRKTLDSLFYIDQKYRKLSNGNYKRFQKEITYGDSIASTSLLKLIQTKGFPNEYNIGLENEDKRFFHKFYFIIWHQLATNLYSPQVVNFSDEISKALNIGKITPENAAFLLDLLSGKNTYTSLHFDINAFVLDNGSGMPIYEQIKNNTYIKDCCYATYMFFPDKRPEKMLPIIDELNKNRKSIGLCSVDDDLKKKIFTLKNKDYIFPEATIKAHQMATQKDLDFMRGNMFKIE